MYESNKNKEIILHVSKRFLLCIMRTLMSHVTDLYITTAVQHERGPRTSTIRKQVALYFRGHKEVNGSSTHFPSTSITGPPFFTTVTQLEPHNLELNTVTSTPERQAIMGLAQPTPKVNMFLHNSVV